jgi:[ribosomal protein S5]-alanine N-acetyltransferase
MFETKRLFVKPLTYNQLLKLSTSPEDFGDDLGLVPSESLTSDETLEAIRDTLLPNLSDPDKDPLFCTMWIIIEKETNSIAGGFCFHSEPDENGEVEIGYGTDEGYRNRGIMTETIGGLISWLRQNNKASILKAETHPDNPSSIQVLLKNGFKEFSRSDSSVILKLELN